MPREPRRSPICGHGRVSHGIGGTTLYMKRAGTSPMAGAKKKTTAVGGKTTMDRKRSPDWTSGLKQLYDQVVEEPIPDAFKDLLSRLDDGKK